jgi:predicted transcriptional regulator
MTLALEMSRTRVSRVTETEILTKSRRRCCLCFALNRDWTEKSGQLAHLDRDPSNSVSDNLAFLCLPHHDRYDGRTSQSKGFTADEVKVYRSQVYSFLEQEWQAHRAATPSPTVSPPNPWTNDHEEALELYVAPHRTMSAVLSVSEGAKTLEEINQSIPPCDLDWTRVIVAGVIDRGWVGRTLTTTERYELTEKGRRILAALREIPESTKQSAWDQVWKITSKDFDDVA